MFLPPEHVVEQFVPCLPQSFPRLGHLPGGTWRSPRLLPLSVRVSQPGHRLVVQLRDPPLGRRRTDHYVTEDAEGMPSSLHNRPRPLSRPHSASAPQARRRRGHCGSASGDLRTDHVSLHIHGIQNRTHYVLLERFFANPQRPRLQPGNFAGNPTAISHHADVPPRTSARLACGNTGTLAAERSRGHRHTGGHTAQRRATSA